jgi:chromosome segregation ATPase
MIERMITMSTKKDFTIEELKKQCAEAERNFKLLNAQLEEKEREEKELREAKLAMEKDARKEEVDACIAHCKELVKAYMHDYGIYSFTSTDDDTIFSSRFWNWIW